MGSTMSRATRKSSSSSHHHPPSPPIAAEPPVRTVSTPNFGSNSNVDPREQINPSEADLSSYEAASRADPDLQTFNSILQLRTSRAINSIAVDLDSRSLSLDSLREVTESLLEMNQEAVKAILKNKKDIWNNPELSDLVDDYFENSLLTLDFCTALDACLKRAGHIESIINVALRKFEEEHYTVPEGSMKNYSRTLEELNNFRAAEAPFSPEFFTVFSSIYTKQISMLERLQARKRKLDKRLGKVKAWKKVSYVIFVSTFAAILICSVLAAALHASPVVAALATAAAAVPLGSLGRWLNSLWKKYEKELKGEREIITSMQIGNYFMIKDMDSIRVSVDRFQIEIEALIENADFATREDEAVVIAMEEIRKKVDVFVKTIHDLSEHANKCTQATTMARTVILRRIINHPKSSNEDLGMFS